MVVYKLHVRFFIRQASIRLPVNNCSKKRGLCQCARGGSGGAASILARRHLPQLIICAKIVLKASLSKGGIWT